MSSTKTVTIKFIDLDIQTLRFEIKSKRLALFIENKNSLARLCLQRKINSTLTANDITIFRKSKRSKRYVKLEKEEDFEILARSLQVKDVLQLAVKANKEATDPESSDPEFADSVSAGSKSTDAEATNSEPNKLRDISSVIEFFESMNLPCNLLEDEYILQACVNAIRSSQRKIEGILKQTNTPSGETESSGTNEKEEEKEVHLDACCDSCNPVNFKPIIGTRYKCLECNNFDLCGECDFKNVEINGHTMYHTMQKIPRSTSLPFAFKKPGVEFQKCPSKSAFVTSKVEGNDIVYDIPLGSCSLANKDKLDSLLRSGNIDDFFRNIDKYIENSNRYNDLLSTLESGEDSNEKYACILSLVEQFNQNTAEEKKESKNDVSNDMPEVDMTEANPEVMVSEEDTSSIPAAGTILIETTKTFSRCMSLKLSNKSLHTIAGCSLEFTFYNELNNISVSVPSPHNVLPGQTKSFNLRFGNEDPDFPSFSNTKIRIPTSDPGIAMEGDFVEGLSTLSAITRGSLEIQSNKREEPEEELKVLVSLYIKSKGVAQIVVTNYSEEDIDCSDLKFEIINCFGQSICSLLVHKRHALSPGRTARFNISLSSAHLKYPFQLIMKNDEIEGVCELNIKNLTGRFKIVQLGNQHEIMDDQLNYTDTDKNITEETDTDTEIYEVSPKHDNALDVEQNQNPLGLVSSAPVRSASPGTIQSMVLPTLPRESLTLSRPSSLSNSEYVDAISSMKIIDREDQVEDLETENVTLEADYDIVSSDPGEDFGSDYEILSPVTSNNQE